MTSSENSERAWSKSLVFIFRTVFIFYLLQIIPYDLDYFRQLAASQLPGLHYGEIFNLAHYYPAILNTSPSFADWGLFLLLAVVGATGWTIARPVFNNSYNDLHYWFRVMLRYRLALAIIAYGFLKFFPLQAPQPSISNLNTAYGDFTRWKLFALSLGIVPSYQSFLGGIEVMLGLLLLFRKTASLAAFIIVVFTGNVFMSNLAYDGGEAVYSFFLIGMAFFILLYDLQRIINLLILQIPTTPNNYRPAFFTGWRRNGRLIIKILFVVFLVGIYGFKTKQGFKTDQFQYPKTTGLPGFTGLYHVAAFKLGNDTLAYSKTDSLRWTDVVFEKWNTISIRSARHVIIDSNNIDIISGDDKKRRFELEGTAGRHYYSYDADTAKQVLVLTNRNPHYANEKLLLNFRRTSDSTIILDGQNYDGKPVHAELLALNKKYLLKEVARRGRRKSFKL